MRSCEVVSHIAARWSAWYVSDDGRDGLTDDPIAWLSLWLLEITWSWSNTHECDSSIIDATSSVPMAMMKHKASIYVGRRLECRVRIMMCKSDAYNRCPQPTMVWPSGTCMVSPMIDDTRRLRTWLFRRFAGVYCYSGENDSTAMVYVACHFQGSPAYHGILAAQFNLSCQTECWQPLRRLVQTRVVTPSPVASLLGVFNCRTYSAFNLFSITLPNYR